MTIIIKYCYNTFPIPNHWSKSQWNRSLCHDFSIKKSKHALNHRYFQCYAIDSVITIFNCNLFLITVKSVNKPEKYQQKQNFCEKTFLVQVFKFLMSIFGMWNVVKNMFENHDLLNTNFCDNVRSSSTRPNQIIFVNTCEYNCKN